jgi:hypothetical protein
MGCRTRAFVDRTQKSVYAKAEGNRELVTVIETICADGTSLKPTAIFKGKKISAAWGRNNPIDARYES